MGKQKGLHCIEAFIYLTIKLARGARYIVLKEFVYVSVASVTLPDQNLGYQTSRWLKIALLCGLSASLSLLVVCGGLHLRDALEDFIFISLRSPL